MTTRTPLHKTLKLGALAALAGALTINAGLGWLIVRSPDGARFLAMHPATQPPHQVADLGQLSPIRVCAQKQKG